MAQEKRSCNSLDDENDCQVVTESSPTFGIFGAFRKMKEFLSQSPKKPKLHTEMKSTDEPSSSSASSPSYKFFRTKNSQEKPNENNTSKKPVGCFLEQKSRLRPAITPTKTPRLSDPKGQIPASPSFIINNGVDRNYHPVVIKKNHEPEIVEIKGKSSIQERFSAQTPYAKQHTLLPAVNQPTHQFIPRPAGGFYNSPRSSQPSTSKIGLSSNSVRRSSLTNNGTPIKRFPSTTATTPSSSSSSSKPQKPTTSNLHHVSSEEDIVTSSTLNNSTLTYSNKRNMRISTRLQSRTSPCEVTIQSDDDDDDAMEIEEPISDQVLHYGSDRCGGNITITSSDLKCLRKEEFLNDVILDFYLTWILDHEIDSVIARTVHIFSTFFFTKLTQATNNASPSKQDSIPQKYYSRAKNWLKKVDIFSKDYLIVPVNRRSHWFLLIVCHPGEVPDVDDDELCSLASNSSKKPCILIFDSLGVRRTGGKNRLTDPLRYLLAEVYKAKHGKEKQFDHILLPDRNIKTTLQTNSYDCGLYLLQYVEQFLKDPLAVINSEPGDLKNWVDYKVIGKKREQIKSLIMQMSKGSKAKESCIAPTITLCSPDKKETSEEAFSNVNASEVLDVE